MPKQLHEKITKLLEQYSCNDPDIVASEILKLISENEIKFPGKNEIKVKSESAEIAPLKWENRRQSFLAGIDWMETKIKLLNNLK